jgi:hypothetical protein
MGQRCCIERGEAARAAPSASVSYYNSEAVQKVLSTDSVASRVDEYRGNLNLNAGEMAFRPTFWTASEQHDANDSC